MSLRSGIINDYSVPMGTSTFARPTRDLNWTIYWFIQVLAVHLSPFIPVQAVLISIQSWLLGSGPELQGTFKGPWEYYSVNFTP